MKLGDVLRKERQGKGLNRHKSFGTEEVAKELGISTEEYETIELGDSPAEKWFPLLCQIAVKLKVHTSRLLAESGKSQDTKPGQAGERIRSRREDQGKTIEEMAKLLDVDVPEYVLIEKGDSPIEKYGPLMLRFADLIEQPVFNLYLPCGVSYSKLDDYP